MKIRNLVLLLTFVLTTNVLAAKQLGNANAPKFGTFKYNLETAPTTLNALSSTDAYASRVQAYVLESLLERNVDTYEWEPSLATKWDISKDGTVFTFTLREGVQWHDGKPLTVEDVKFSFDAIMDPKNKYKTAHLKSYYENIKEAKIVDPKTIQFIAKQKYFSNFDTAAGLTIVPKHLYENPDKEMEKKLNKTLVGTGAYILDKYDRGKNLELKLNEKWWGLKEKKGVNNFKKISMKFVKEDTKAIQHLEKGNLDFIGLQPEKFVKNTTGPKWGKSVFKVKVENKAPKGYSFLAWNNNNVLFKNKEIRRAMAHLFNRELMIEKFLFNMSMPATGPLYQQSDYADHSVKPIPFDPKKALEILRKQGWKDTDGDQILDKMIDGKKVSFSFTILEPLQDFMKYLTIFKEDAKKAGIDVKLKFVEWNTFIKLLDERKFEAVRLAWGAGAVDWDPKQIWHSDSIANGGSNFISYKNPKVDKYIDEARMTLDKKARVKVLNKAFKEIADDAPYVFLFNSKFSLYGHTKRLKRVKDTYNYGIGTGYWWLSK
ncbi:MAG: peptide ABC transporter substrate-binding protein [Deltaproteobacteria bacterium]|nr:MAG: peptide ABC transporter substrate-binding protein [Deltaproteobacteria bacterium]TNF27563.1 MAG: peptide ABC transporter substrate-binding protein [Deltaproteobacteria bacterium]